MLHEKYTPNIFIVSLVKSTDCIPQTATSTPFSGPNPQISHLEILGFKPEKDENKVNVFTSSSIDSCLQEKTLYHLHKLCIKKDDQKY